MISTKPESGRYLRCRKVINCVGGGPEDDGKMSVRYMEVCRGDFPGRGKVLHRDMGDLGDCIVFE